MATNEAHADPAEQPPESVELIDFGAVWHLKRSTADTAPPTSDASERAATNEWDEGDAPFVGRYGGGGGRGGTRLSMRGLEQLPLDPNARSDDERASEEIFWLSRDVEVDDASAVESLLLEARFVGGFVVFINGEEVLRHRLDLEGRYQPFGEVPEMPGFVREGRRASGQRAFRGVDPSPLRDGTNTIAVRVHRKPGDLDRALLFDMRAVAWTESGFVKGPYLQRVTPNSITVMFETTSITTPYVEFGSGGKLTRSATSPATGGTLHEVTLTDLQPDTRYFYRVRAEKIWPPLDDEASPSVVSSNYFFRTAPHRDAGFTFLAYGDNRSQPAVHRAVVERMLAEKAAFALNTGDLTETGVDYEEWQEQFFEPALQLMHYVPMWPSLGNHDGNHISYFEQFALPGNEAWYSFRYGNAEFFALNTIYNLREGSAQYQWLDDALARSDARWKVVFFHHPPFSCTPARLPGFGPVRRHIVPLFEEHGVDLVLSGHDHLYAHAEKNGIHYVITGGGGAWTYPVQVEPPNIYCKQVYHYTVVTVDDAALFLRAVDKDGGEVDAFAIRRP